MPELPEVETTRRGLHSLMLNQPLLGVTVRNRSLRLPIPADLPARTQNTTVTGLRRRAKYILMDLNTGDTLLIHLGMSGRLTAAPAIKPPAKHDHVIFHLPNGQDVRFNDARRFGMVLLLRTAEVETHPLLAHLGPEPLEPSFTPTYLAAQLKHRSSPIKTVLMNNHVVVGVGNIYANEALFRAQIDPRRPALTLSKKEVANLHMAVVVVLKEAIAAGGTSLRDYAQTDGSLGYFYENFAVYGRHGQPCLTCGAVIQKQVIGQRSSWFCPACQH